MLHRDYNIANIDILFLKILILSIFYSVYRYLAKRGI